MNRRISDLLDGYEDGSVDLTGDTPLSPARIKELTRKRITRKKSGLPRILGAAAAAAACMGLVFLAGYAARTAEHTPGGPDSQDPHPATEPASEPAADTDPYQPPQCPDNCDMLPGGFNPVLRCNGIFYHWVGLNQSSYSGYVDEAGRTHTPTYLPAGFEAVGDFTVISHLSEEEPNELELKAGFNAAGTVFANPEKPAAVYVRMETEWFAESYVRFTADYYESGLICFEDQLYWFSFGSESPHLDELPEDADSVGALHVVDKDLIPSGQLEINFSTDSYGNSLEGREVFRVPTDSDAIYVYEEQFWRGGSYDAWVTCPRWEGPAG